MATSPPGHALSQLPHSGLMKVLFSSSLTEHQGLVSSRVMHSLYSSPSYVKGKRHCWPTLAPDTVLQTSDPGLAEQAHDLRSSKLTVTSRSLAGMLCLGLRSLTSEDKSDSIG